MRKRPVTGKKTSKERVRESHSQNVKSNRLNSAASHNRSRKDAAPHYQTNLNFTNLEPNKSGVRNLLVGRPQSCSGCR